MPDIIIVTSDEMKRFIRSQENRRPVNMLQIGRHCDCGCVMVHYGLAMGFDFYHVGLYKWIRQGLHPVYAELEVNSIYKLFAEPVSDCKNYGQLKAKLHE